MPEQSLLDGLADPVVGARHAADTGAASRNPLPNPDTDDLTGYVTALSGGQVTDIRPSGPVFGSYRPRRQAQRDLYQPALSRRTRIALAALSVGWGLTLIGFWFWWLQPQHRLGWLGFFLNSLLLGYASCVPIYFLLAVRRMARVSPSVPIPRLRVAMIVTKAPSEPWSMVRTTLTAMINQDFPYDYDVWLADEAPTDEVRQWCGDHGVLISTRQGDERYQRETWPRRRRCKEGNLAYFYDHYGYAGYDVVSQLDSDHVPAPDYLAEMVRPFADPAVGYVSAPSICDANADISWTVRGRVQEEATFHGPQQLGFNLPGTPICIGSHYAVRTGALREIGGLGPELAEDFSTAYLLNIAGWRGSFAADAEAHGDGPTTFGAMITQEFQWSRSLTTVALGLVSRTVGALGIRRAADFVFRCGLYQVITAVTVGGLALFATSCLWGLPWVSVNLLIFAAFWIGLNLWQVVIKALVRHNGLTRPRQTPLVGWEAALYVLTRWPFIAFGVTAAIIELLIPQSVDFKVTPKGDGGPEPLPLRQIVPALVAGLVLVVSAFIGRGYPQVIGYVGLALLSAIMIVIAVGAVAVLHARDARRVFGASATTAVDLVAAPIVAVLVVATPTAILSIEYLQHLARFFLR